MGNLPFFPFPSSFSSLFAISWSADAIAVKEVFAIVMSAFLLPKSLLDFRLCFSGEYSLKVMEVLFFDDSGC